MLSIIFVFWHNLFAKIYFNKPNTVQFTLFWNCSLVVGSEINSDKINFNFSRWFNVNFYPAFQSLHFLGQFCDPDFSEVHTALTMEAECSYERWQHSVCFVSMMSQHISIDVNRCLYEPGSSGSIVSGYGLDHRAIEVRSPAGTKNFSSSLCVQTGSGAHPASCTMGTGVPFPGGKTRPGRKAAEVRNE
jgi:hypothetical protein